eukprot:scaffold12280_cov32-Tisochrysis_lutea.AAC.2
MLRFNSRRRQRSLPWPVGGCLSYATMGSGLPIYYTTHRLEPLSRCRSRAKPTQFYKVAMAPSEGQS